jgi:hypothetical protein
MVDNRRHAFQVPQCRIHRSDKRATMNVEAPPNANKSSLQNIPSADLVRVLYIELSGDKKQCRLCGKVPKPNGTGGNTNWARHIRGKHRPEYHAAFADYTKGEAKMKDFYNVVISEKARNAYRWIDWIVNDHHPLAFCTKPRTR